MKSVLRYIAYGLFVVGLIAFWLLAGSRYGWMEAMDPSISAGSIEDESNSRTIVTILLLLLMVVSQLAVAAKATGRGERIISIVLAIVAVAAWFVSRSG